MVTVNVVFLEPPPDQPRRISMEFPTVPRVGEIIFNYKIDHCNRQVVKKVGYVVSANGCYPYLILAPDPDETMNDLWDEVIR